MDNAYSGLFSVPMSTEPPMDYVETQIDDSGENSPSDASGGFESQQSYQEPPQYIQPTVEAPQDYWTMPQDLPSSEQLSWYNERYGAVMEYLGSDQYKAEVEQQRQAMLDEAAQEIEDYKIVYQALKTNPQDYILQYLPEVLIQHGINPVMSIEDIGSKVHDQLARQFGADYQERINPNELFNPTSFSATVYNQQQQLVSEYNAMNAKNKELFDNWGQMVADGKINTQQPQQQQLSEPPMEALMEAYQTAGFKDAGFSEQEYVEFLEQAQNHKLDLTDVHKVIHFESYLTEAYKQGLAEGQKSFYQRATSSGNATRQSVPQQQPQRPYNQQESEQEEFMRAMKTFANGGIPYY